METVKLTNNHGEFTTTGYGLDRAIALYLPASPDDLRKVMAESTGRPPEYYYDVHSVGEFLMMLADADFPSGGQRRHLTVTERFRLT